MNEISHQSVEVAVKPGEFSQPEKRSELDEVKHLATIGCPNPEIADKLGYGLKALERRYGKVIRQARAEGLAKLRESQWNKATADANVPMQIWLGRQMLGQSQRAATAAEEMPARVVLDLSQGP